MRRVGRFLSATLLLCSLSVGAQAPPIPQGKIVILPGYQHERVATPRDTRNGRIWKDPGLSINYQIGGQAGNRINGNPSLQWSKEQTVAGNRVQIGMTKDRMLIVVFSSLTPPQGLSSVLPANFYATVNSDEEIADMLFMVMTYNPN